MAPDDLVPGIIRLGQACIRVADLVFTQRIAAQGSFAEEVESLIDDTGLDYEPNAKVVGRGNVIVPVDFLIKARRVETAMFTLPAESSYATAAKLRANEVFVRCFDLHDWPGSLRLNCSKFSNRSICRQRTQPLSLPDQRCRQSRGRQRQRTRGESPAPAHTPNFRRHHRCGSRSGDLEGSSQSGTIPSGKVSR